jgi:hypothetical protein
MLAEGQDFYMKRCTANDDFTEDGDEDIDDLVRAGKDIRWSHKIPRFLR